MRFEIFSIYDKTINVFNVPYFARTHVEGVRSFVAACRGPDSMLAKFPESFELHHLGNFEDTTNEWSVFPRGETMLACTAEQALAPVPTAP